MLKKGVELEERDLGRELLTSDELDVLIGDRNHLDFLNPKNELYRKMRMKEDLPSRAEALKWMAKEPNLIRRPLVIRGGQMVLGYDEERLKKLSS